MSVIFFLHGGGSVRLAACASSLLGVFAVQKLHIYVQGWSVGGPENLLRKFYLRLRIDSMETGGLSAA
jgi:hypothetical protein